MTGPPLVSDFRYLRRFLAGQAASFLGDGVIGVALAFAVLDAGGSAADVGLVIAARSVAMVGFLLFGGVVADRVSRRTILVGCDVARLAAQAAMAAMVIGGVTAIWPLAVLNVLHGTASGLFAPAAVGIVPSIAPAGRLQQANAMRGMAYSLGNIAGPALAGVLVAAFGPGQAIGAASAAYLVSAVLLARLPATAPGPSDGRSVLGDLREGWKGFRARRWVWATVVFSSLGNLLLAAFLVLGPVIAERSLGGPPAWAAVMTALGAGAFVGGLAALRIRPGRPLRVAVPLAALSALPALALAADRPVTVVAAVTFTAGMGLTIFNALWETSLQTHIPHSQLSRVSSWDDFGSFICQPLGQALVGPLAAGIGITSTLWLAGGLQIFITALLLCVPAIRTMPAARADTREPSANPAQTPTRGTAAAPRQDRPG
ncbi:MFS transporter [Actinocorallia libanotica]|uniref:MFS transporter n=1 Tax=Actinocorallia libanotica TaxID=46162 RepID=A0ABP4BYT6_9ACTN